MVHCKTKWRAHGNFEIEMYKSFLIITFSKINVFETRIFLSSNYQPVQDLCHEAAQERGYALGGAGYPFAADHVTAGCY